jgi:hypothetical protein
MIQQIGTIWVDTGLCWIGDPCRILHPESSGAGRAVSLGKNWKDFCDKTRAVDEQGFQQFAGNNGWPPIGIAVRTGIGDGDYAVYAEMDGGLVVKVWIEFLAYPPSLDDEHPAPLRPWPGGKRGNKRHGK